MRRLPKLSPKLPQRSAATGLRAPWRSACVAGLLGAAASAVAFAPAAWLASAVHSATNGKLLLANAQGSIWRGSSQVVLTGGADTQDASSLPGRMQWRLSPALLGARMQIELPCCTAPQAAPMQLLLQPGWQRMQVQVQDAALQFPAQWLAGLGAPWNTLDPQGQMSLSAQQLSVNWAAGRMSVQGTAQLDMLEMSSRLSTLSPLGDYRLNLNGGDVPTIELRTLQGALQLQGTGQLVGSRIRFQGEASAAEGREAALSNVLNILGRRQGNKSLISLG